MFCRGDHWSPAYFFATLTYPANAGFFGRSMIAPTFFGADLSLPAVGATTGRPPVFFATLTYPANTCFFRRSMIAPTSSAMTFPYLP